MSLVTDKKVCNGLTGCKDSHSLSFGKIIYEDFFSLFGCFFGTLYINLQFPIVDENNLDVKLKNFR